MFKEFTKQISINNAVVSFFVVQCTFISTVFFIVVAVTKSYLENHLKWDDDSHKLNPGDLISLTWYLSEKYLLL